VIDHIELFYLFSLCREKKMMLFLTFVKQLKQEAVAFMESLGETAVVNKVPRAAVVKIEKTRAGG